MPHTWDPSALSPDRALERLAAGNRRFLETGGGARARPNAQLVKTPQRPIAVVLGCSDSRMPVEIVFDEGFGDLFVVRVAGHVVAPSVVGSVEFAVSQFGPRLVIVLGHTHCGAVGAALRAIETGQGPGSRNVRAITDRIVPHILELARAGGDDVARKAMRAYVRAAADHLRHGSRTVEELVLAGRVAVVGAEYDIETGKVEVFDGVPLPPYPSHPS